MRYLKERLVEKFNRTHDIYSKEEARQILEIIMDEESLTGRQATHYDFIESFYTYGTSWVDTKELVEFVNLGVGDGEMVGRDVIIEIMNTPTLHLLTSGRWIGWDY